MAGYRALAAAGRSIVDLLNRRFAEALPTPPRPTAVLATTRDFDEVNSSPNAVIQFPAVSVYCYRLSIDPETRPGLAATTSADGLARLPLRMHLLIAAWDTFAESELEWLGLAAQVLESDGLLAGHLLHPSGGWDDSDLISVVPDEVALISMSEAFQALTTDYRVCLPYLARVIRIDGRQVDTAERVTMAAAAARPMAGPRRPPLPGLLRP
jgi:Pvc16 N-terminal domain